MMSTRMLRLGQYAVLACTMGVLSTARAEEQGVAWLGNYRQALREAKETGKPLFVEFRCEA